MSRRTSGAVTSPHCETAISLEFEAPLVTGTALGSVLLYVPFHERGSPIPDQICCAASDGRRRQCSPARRLSASFYASTRFSRNPIVPSHVQSSFCVLFGVRLGPLFYPSHRGRLATGSADTAVSLSTTRSQSTGPIARLGQRRKEAQWRRRMLESVTLGDIRLCRGRAG